MTTTAQGRCLACETPGPPDRTEGFLCGLCAHPDEIRSYCRGCRSRRNYVPEEVADLCRFHDLSEDVHPGQVLVLPRCGNASCFVKSPDASVIFFSIAALPCGDFL